MHLTIVSSKTGSTCLGLTQRLEISWHKSGIFLPFPQWYTGILFLQGLAKSGELLKGTPMPTTHISRSVTLPWLQVAAHFLGRPQLLTRA